MQVSRIVFAATALLTMIIFPILPSFAANPTVAKIKVKQFAVSANVDCSSPTVVFGPVSTPVEVDMLVGPTIGGGVLATGSYPCVIITMSDNITFTSDTTTGSCTAGVSNTINVCHSNEAVDRLDGTTVTSTTCTDSNGPPTQEDFVSIWITTASTGGQTAVFQRPAVGSTSTVNGFKLNGAFVVTSSTVGQFVMNLAGKIDGSGTNCDLQPPSFSFR